MTVAICIKCGAFKFGAYNPCRECGALPETEDDYAVSFVLTDHFNDSATLEKVGAQIASGIKPYLAPGSMPPEMLESIHRDARRAKEVCERMAAFAKKQQLAKDEPPDSA